MLDLATLHSILNLMVLSVNLTVNSATILSN